MGETVFPKPLDQEVAELNAHLGSLVTDITLTGITVANTDAIMVLFNGSDYPGYIPVAMADLLDWNRFAGFVKYPNGYWYTTVINKATSTTNLKVWLLKE